MPRAATRPAPPADRAAWLLDWQTYIAQSAPLLPVLFPADCPPANDARCGCCRAAEWDLRDGWYLCTTCHPMPAGAAESSVRRA